MGHLTHEYHASAPDKVVNTVGSFDIENHESGTKSFKISESVEEAISPHSNQSSMEYLIKAFIIKTDERLKTHSVVIQNLERQVGHIASLLSEKSVGTLSADTKRNPNKTINVVSLRNGKILQDPLVAEKELTENQVKNEGEQISDEHHRNEVRAKQEDNLKKKNKYEVPTRKKKEKQRSNDEIEEKVLSQMPAYAKFLKEIWSKKRKVEETSVVKLTEHCSAILQNKLPQKCGNPGSLTIPCSLISTKFEKSLCDLGASINRMYLSIFRKLEGQIGEIM
nr:uncharacterized protein LOC104089152 [Nicotiana tomentosiformis]